MKKSLYFIFMALLCAMGCQVQELEGPEEVIVGQESFYAEIEQESKTKTYIDEFNNVRFQKGDQIAIFENSTLGVKYQLEDAADGKTSGMFYKVVESGNGGYGVGTQTNAIVAYYPYSSLELDATSLTDGNFVLKGINLPATQKYDAKNIVSQNALPMLSAKTDNDKNITFRNICGVIRLNIKGYGSIKQISFKGLNNEKICGAATVSISPNDNPLISMESTATGEVVLDCGETGVALSPDVAKQFMIVLPPMKFEKGFEVKVTDTKNGSTVKKAVPSAGFTYEVKRSRIMDMGEFTYGQAPTPGDVVPDNQIWYTTSDGLILEPKDGTAACFGANVTSNVYSNGKGVITFDGKVTKIGDNAFRTKTKLVTFSIPSTVKTLGASAFDGCFRLSGIKLPEGLESIGSGVFNGCTELKELSIPGTVSTVQGFKGCTSLETVIIKKGVQCIGNEAFSGCKKLSSVTIPEGVTSIGYDAFSGCSSLASVTIPEGVTKIGFHAFENCSSLASVVIPAGVTGIGGFTFSGCSGLTSVTIPAGVTIIGNDAFSGCSSLTSVTIPEGVEGIAECAFFGCSSLTSVTIPEGVRGIGRLAFKYCSSLTSVTILAGVTSIGDAAFCGCSSLTSVTIEEGVTSIGREAFENCSSLISVTIPEGVNSIGIYAFSGCSKLSTVYCRPVNVPTGGTSMFGNNAPGRNIYVPMESVEAYKAANNWSDYAADIVGYDFSKQ